MKFTVKAKIKTAVVLVLVCSLANVQAQRLPKTDWKLDKVVWSQVQHDSTTPGKPVLDFNTLDKWAGLGSNLTISADGRYVAYETYNGFPGQAGWSGKTVIQATEGSVKLELPRISGFGFFSGDSRQFVFEDKEGLCFLRVANNERSYVKDIESYKTPTGNQQELCKWIAYLKKSKELVLQNLSRGEQKQFSDVASYDFCRKSDGVFSEKWFYYQTAGSTTELVFCDLTTGKDYHLPEPKSFTFFADGGMLLLDKGNTLELINITSGSKTVLWTSQNSAGGIEAPLFDKAGKQVVFTTNEDNGNSIWIWKEGMPKAKIIASQSSIKAEPGFLLQSGVEFSENGHFVIFKLEKAAEKFEVPKGAVELTLWSSRDPLLQTVQMAQQGNPTKLRGIMNAQTGEVLYISKSGERGDLYGDASLLVTKGTRLDYPSFDTDRFWDSGYYLRSYSITNLKTGKNYPMGTFLYGTNIFASPERNYFIYYDINQGNYFSINLNTGRIENLCKGLKPGYFGKRDYLSPGTVQSKYPYDAVGGWMEDGSGFLVYDDFDLWLLDPTGKPPLNLTNGYGRKNNISFRIERTDYSSQPLYKKNEILLLNAFGVRTKENGFFSLTLNGRNSLEKLTMGPYFIHSSSPAVMIDGGQALLKAASADVWVVKRHSPETGANYYITKDLKSYQPLTSIRPHMDVNWYTRELHHFKCLDGTEGEGVLYKPENFDSTKKYPVIMPYYSRSSEDLFVYQEPELATAPSSFVDSPAWLVSHGYLVFVPAVTIVELVYGPSCFSLTEGAAKYLNSLPYVDKGKIGAMTHSWSSKLGVYQFTHSKLIKAMWINEGYTFGDVINTAFAPQGGNAPGIGVSNNGEYGFSSMEEVENVYGFGEFWTNKKTWLDQTTVLNVDKSSMPLMLSCNPNDLKLNTYASQSFEVFTALRRLNKPVWWFRYGKNSQSDHNFYANERYDITIRMTQFFDHFLKNAPAPRWMTQGIPNKLVGVETRHELDAAGNCALEGKHCYVCEAWNKQYKRTPQMLSKDISEWKMDKDIEAEMNKKLTAERLEREKGSEQTNREVMKMLRDAMKKVDEEEKKEKLKIQILNQKNSK